MCIDITSGSTGGPLVLLFDTIGLVRLELQRNRMGFYGLWNRTGEHRYASFSLCIMFPKHLYTPEVPLLAAVPVHVILSLCSDLTVVPSSLPSVRVPLATGWKSVDCLAHFWDSQNSSPWERLPSLSFFFLFYFSFIAQHQSQRIATSLFILMASSSWCGYRCVITYLSRCVQAWFMPSLFSLMCK